MRASATRTLIRMATTSTATVSLIFRRLVMGSPVMSFLSYPERVVNEQEGTEETEGFSLLAPLPPVPVRFGLVAVAPTATIAATAVTALAAAAGTLFTLSGDVDVESTPAQFFAIQG